MNREVISDKQGISTLVLFLCGSTLIFDTAVEAKEDVWLALFIAVIAAFIVVTLYARVLYLFPEKDIYDILTIVFGDVIGKIFCFFYVFFSIHVASLVLYNFEEFITLLALDETPALVPLVTTMLLIIWIMKAGIRVLGGWCEIFVVVIFFLIFSTMPFFIPIAKLENLKPFLYHGIKPILNAAFKTFTFPFGETLIFMGIGSALSSKKSPYKVYGWGLFFGALIIFSSAVVHTLVLNEQGMTRTFFPPYRAYKLINVKNFFNRIEIVIGASLIICGFLKITICLISTCKGICKIFAVDNYKIMAVPVCIIATIISTTNFRGVLELTEWINSIWKWYAIFFELILFIIIYIGAEIKGRKKNRC